MLAAPLPAKLDVRRSTAPSGGLGLDLDRDSRGEVADDVRPTVEGIISCVHGVGKRLMIVSDDGAELTSVAILRWTQEHRIERHCIARPRPAILLPASTSTAEPIELSDCQPLVRIGQKWIKLTQTNGSSLENKPDLRLFSKIESSIPKLRSGQAFTPDFVRRGSVTDTQKKSHLIVCDEHEPTVVVKPGMRFEVLAVSVVDEQLAASRKVAARLCGGTNTCLALVEI